MASAPEWWYMAEHLGDQPQGPESELGLLGLFHRAEIHEATFVWRDGQAEWQRLAAVKVLRELLHSVPPAVKQQHGCNALPTPSQPVRGLDDLHKVLTGGGLLAVKAAAERKHAKRARKKDAQLRAAVNTAVCINGLPNDVTEAELEPFFAKCGVIKPDPDTLRPSIHLHKNHDGSLRGDATVVYALEPSVDNALLLLDEADLRPGTKTVVRVSRAHLNSETDKPPEQKRVKGPQDPKAEAARVLVKDALSWADEDQRDTGRGFRIVILRGVFHPDQAAGDDCYLRIEDMVETRCSQIGPIDKVTAFRKNVEGVVAIRFRVAADAARCLQVMNGTSLNGQTIQAFFFDGKTDYRHKETEEESAARMKEWSNWLDDDQDDADGTDAAPNPQPSCRDGNAGLGESCQEGSQANQRLTPSASCEARSLT